MEKTYIHIYNKLIELARNKELYKDFEKQDIFSDRLTFFLLHFAIFFIVFRKKDNKKILQEIYDFIFIKPLKKIGVFFWKKGDQDTIDRFGPDGISKVIKFISNKAVQFQSGYIYDYAFVMLIGLSALITYLIFT